MAGNGTTSAARLYNLADIYVGDTDATAPTNVSSESTTARTAPRPSCIYAR